MLVENIGDFLRNNPLYSVPCQIPFFIPKKMTADVLTMSYLNLVRRLYRYSEILRRSAVSNPFEALKILVMNLELRKKYMLMNKIN